MADVKLTAASLELRTMKLTRSLLQQFRRLKGFPKEFLATALTEQEEQRLLQIKNKYSTVEGVPVQEFEEAKALAEKKRAGSTRLSPRTCIGWVHGSTLKEETEVGGYDCILVFVHNGDGYIYPVYHDHFELESWCKQIYIE